MKILYGTSHPGANLTDAQTAITRRHTLIPFERPIHRIISRTLAPDASGLVVFVDSLVTEKVLDYLPKLKFIATQSTGTDHIDLVACKERGITVCNVPGYGHASVSELAMLLLLGVARNLKHSLSNDRIGKLVRDGELGFELRGKTIGIIGTGAIGAATATVAAGFGMSPLLYDRHRKRGLAAKVNGSYVDDIKTIWAQSDIITFHVPLVPATHHLVSYEEIAQMKDGVVLINTARGGIVDSEALLQGLESGKVRGAGLDVLEHEQLLTGRRAKNRNERAIREASRVLMHHPRVLHTMHLGAHTQEAQEAIHLTTIENLKRCINKNKKPKNIVV
jgi:D-lactate dehydrogenase